MSAILGLKRDMTQIFGKDGRLIPCTILDVSGVKMVGKRTKEKDGYEAIILGLGRKKHPTKAEISKFKNLKYVPQHIAEFRTDRIENITDLKIGDGVRADVFKVDDKVNISGKTKGKGFQGVIKRWGFHGGPRTHGQSDRERAPGSIGGGTDPGRVFKGKKMPGHMGFRTKTVVNLKIVKVDSENNLLCVKGAVPGSRNSVLKIYRSK